jgi:AcrR family transcriptional regulator
MSDSKILPPRPPRADAKRNEEALVAAARELFTEKGIDASLEEVAKRAGVGIGTLYRHFPTRQHLVEAILEGQMLSLATRAEELLEWPDAFDALQTWLTEAFSHSKSYRGQSQCVAVALNNCSDESVSPCEIMRNAGDKLLKRAQQQGAVRDDVTANSVITMMNALVWTREQNDSAQTDVLLSVLLEGLRKPL